MHTRLVRKPKGTKVFINPRYRFGENFVASFEYIYVTTIIVFFLVLKTGWFTTMALTLQPVNSKNELLY